MAGWFTKTQLKILLILSDGKPHTRQEIHAALPDELGALTNIKRHISDIRKVLRKQGQDIICTWHQRTFCYVQVRTLVASCDCRGGAGNA